MNARGGLSALLGLAGIWVGIQGGAYRPFGVALAMAGFFFAATYLGRAGRIATAIRPVVGRAVRVEVWGQALAPSDGGLYVVGAVTPLGAGLFFHLVSESGHAGGVLKVAQPGAETLGDDRIEIATAAYVQWAGRKLEPPPGTAAPALALGVP